MSSFLQRMAQSVSQPARSIRPVVARFAPAPRHEVPVLSGEPEEIFPPVAVRPVPLASRSGEPPVASSERFRERPDRTEPAPLVRSPAGFSEPLPVQVTGPAETAAEAVPPAGATTPHQARSVPPRGAADTTRVAAEPPEAAVAEQAVSVAPLPRPRAPDGRAGGDDPVIRPDEADAGPALMGRLDRQAGGGLAGLVDPVPVDPVPVDPVPVDPVPVDPGIIDPTHPRLAARAEALRRPPGPAAAGRNATAMPRERARAPDDIEIRIGRIEVTAVQPAPMRPPDRPARKAISLDEYLRRRDGRR